MTDHAPYIHTVARVLTEAGFHVLSVGGHDWQPRGGHIELGAQDGWDDYRYETADVRWDEPNGWSCLWGGITHELSVPLLASPATVAIALGHLLGPTPGRLDFDRFASVRAEAGTAEFDAALAAYVEVSR